MANVLLSFDNLADSATLTGGSWQSTMPRANVQDPRVSKRARSTSASASHATITATWSSAKSVRFVALVGHNLSADADFTFSNALSGTSFFDPAAIYWNGSVWPAGVVYPEYPGLVFYWRAAGAISTADLTITISDASNPAGYIEIGRVWIGGDGFQPADNFRYGDQLAWEDPAVVTESLGGTVYASSMARPKRIARLALGTLTDAERLTLSRAMAAGVGSQVFYARDPAATGTALLHDTFLARCRTLSAVESVALGINGAGLELQEINA